MEGLHPGDPRRVGRYVLVARLGAGGMGVVYLGRSPAGRAVAVKVIRERFAADDAFVARFRREVAAARLVTGVFTAPVLDADVGADGPWLATAYLPGVSLREAVRTLGALPSGAVLTLAAGLVEALVDIHRAGVVHRDLKPGNIMLTRDGPRVIDFGIARPEDATAITRLGAVLGSPGYMSPEQVAGDTVGPAGDIFSLGSVLVFAATAREPFGTGTTEEVLGRVARVDVDLGDVGRGLRGLISSCLRAEPDRRPSAVELLDRLGPGEELPASLVELIDHRAEPLPEADVVYDETIDPTAERRTDEPTKVGRRVVVGGLAVVAGAAALAVTLKRPDVSGLPRPAPEPRPALGSGATTVWRERVSTEGPELTLVGGALLARGHEGGIRALEPRTGDLLWSRDAEFVEAAAGETAFLVNPKGWRLTAVHGATGAEQWGYTPEMGWQSRPVTVVGSIVWCGTGRMAALDLADGHHLRTVGAFNAYLVTTNGLLIALWTDQIGGHDPVSGAHTWTVPARDPVDPQAGGGLVYYCDLAGGIFAVRADSGAAAWQRPGLGSTWPFWFQVADDTVYCSLDGEVVAMDAATGETRWSLPVGERTGTTDPYGNQKKCVLGLVGTTLYAADVDGTMYAVDTANGGIKWTHRTERRVVACPVGVDDLVFLPTSDGYVEAVTPPKGR